MSAGQGGVAVGASVSTPAVEATALDARAALFVDAVLTGDDAGARSVLSEAGRGPDLEAAAALHVWVTSALAVVDWVVPAAVEPDGWPW